jgi:hypothetical protein
MTTKLEMYFVENPDAAAALYLAASEIVDDFEEFGPVLQANLDGEYDESTAIRKLQRIRNEIIAALQAEATQR